MNITELLNIKYPIFQGAMAQISREPLVSAVSNAGALGILASGGLTPDEVRAEIRLIQSQTQQPFAVNLMLKDKNCEEIAKIVVEENVKILTTGAGTPKKYMEQWKKHGIIIIPVVPNVKIAKKMEELGCDAIIAEGTEAGGHIGTTTSLVLWPQVVDAISIPVIGAGGIADSRGFVAAKIMGCSGVQIGTRFMATEECPIGPKYKNEIINAGDTSTIVTGYMRNDLVRALKNDMSLRFRELEFSGSSISELEKLGIGSLRKAAKEDDIVNGSLMSGQASGLVKNIETVNDVIEDIMNHIDEVKNKAFK